MHQGRMDEMAKHNKNRNAILRGKQINRSIQSIIQALSSAIRVHPTCSYRYAIAQMRPFKFLCVFSISHPAWMFTRFFFFVTV